MAADYEFHTVWRVAGAVAEVRDVLADGRSLPRWWPGRLPMFAANHRWAMARGEESLAWNCVGDGRRRKRNGAGYPGDRTECDVAAAHPALTSRSRARVGLES